MNNTVVGVLVLVVVILVGWFAYSQGYFQGAAEENSDGIEIQIGGAPQTNQ